MRTTFIAIFCILLGACGTDAALKVHEDPPTATLMEPGDNDTFIAGSAVAFRVQLDDSDDGVSSLDVQWRSDTLGTLRGDVELDGKVHIFVTDELEVGIHTVTVTATDPDGHTGTDQVEISVVANQPPLIAITSPEPDHTFGEADSITVRVQGNDAEEDVESLRISWTLDDTPVPEAPTSLEADGTSSHTFSPLAIGDHTFTVDTVDTLGEAAQDQVTIRVVPLDGDGDGFDTDDLGGDDCDDTDPEVGPDADEICDGIDNDCDGLVDAEDPDIIGAYEGHPDLDGDGYGDDTTTILTCDLSDLSETGGDCNDLDATMNPSAFEICGDGLDNDCDGSAGACAWSGDVAIETADHTSWGDLADDAIASSFGSGDVTGDGVTDLIIGSHSVDTIEPDAGSVYVLEGPLLMTAGHVGSHTGATIEGELFEDQTGAAVGVSDVDGDGIADLIIGSPGMDPDGLGRNAGKVHLIYGPITSDRNIDASHASFHGMEEENNLGGSATSAGDLDGDGLPDMIMGARRVDGHASEGGAIFIFMGQTSRWAGENSFEDRDTEFTSNETGMRFGERIAYIGDVNSDGRDDLLVGTTRGREHGTKTGAAYLILGHATNFTTGASRLHTSSDATYYGAASRDEAGTAIAGIGDVDGDGYDEFAIGAPYNDDGGTNVGATYLMLDPDITGAFELEDSADIVLRGSDSQSNVGAAIAGNTDLDNDGILDLLIGAPGATVDGHVTGGTFLVYGPITDLEDGILGGSSGVQDATFTGENLGDSSGKAIISGADWTDDGVDDMAIASPDSRSDAGSVYVFFGRGM